MSDHATDTQDDAQYRDERIDRILSGIESGTSKLKLLSALSTSEPYFLRKKPKLIAQKLRLCADKIEELADHQ